MRVASGAQEGTRGCGGTKAQPERTEGQCVGKAEIADVDRPVVAALSCVQKHGRSTTDSDLRRAEFKAMCRP